MGKTTYWMLHIVYIKADSASGCARATASTARDRSIHLIGNARSEVGAPDASAKVCFLVLPARPQRRS